jgi:hypothetical protein
MSVILYSVGAINGICNYGLLFPEKLKDFQYSVSVILGALYKVFKFEVDYSTVLL